MTKSIREAIKEWLNTLHNDLVGLREETQALRVELKNMSELMMEMNRQITVLHDELNWIKERNQDEDDEQGPRWKM
ncbi:MAG: hypothetical protein AB7P14_23650 [Blastocatellales bacterium]